MKLTKTLNVDTSSMSSIEKIGIDVQYVAYLGLEQVFNEETGQYEVPVQDDVYVKALSLGATQKDVDRYNKITYNSRKFMMDQSPFEGIELTQEKDKIYEQCTGKSYVVMHINPVVDKVIFLCNEIKN